MNASTDWMNWLGKHHYEICSVRKWYNWIKNNESSKEREMVNFLHKIYDVRECKWCCVDHDDD